MAKFKQKEFAEYDAMRSLYLELKRSLDRNLRVDVIDSSSIIPVLRGNNIVIEKFVISTSAFGKDRYRMYLKIGARAKMPDEVRLPGKSYDKSIGQIRLEAKSSAMPPKEDDYQQSQGKSKNNNDNKTGEVKDNRNNKPANKNYRSYKKKTFCRESLFSNNNNNKSKGPGPFITSSFAPMINLSYSVNELLGDALSYNKKDRSLVLEFKDIKDAVSALNILPFGIGYKIYLLDA